MKTLKTTKIYFFVLALVILAATLFGCSDESGIFSPVGSGENKFGDNPPAGNVTVEITKEYGGYWFKVTNNSSDTINDFHVQFDTTVSITGYGLAWQLDPATTDLNRGKIGEKCGPHDQPLCPGQNRNLLWVRLKFNGVNKVQTFNWQATKNGVVKESGSGRLPQ
jgi:hypothetical protein